jgi:3-hydroxyacyl-[acyl-carrier-protein] dehydratase
MNQPDPRQCLPHREPFLFVGEIVSIDGRRIICRRTFREDEPFFRGHFPQFPVVPGVLLCEAGLQAAAAWLGNHASAEPGRIPVVTRLADVRFKRMIRPGETVDIEVEFVERLATAYFFRAAVGCQGQPAARFEFACTWAEIPQAVRPG